MSRNQKILVIQLRQLGDILLTTPVFREIKRERPSCHLTFFSHPMGHLVIDGSPYVDEFYTYDPNASLRQKWQLAQILRSRRFDLVLDFMNNPRSAFYTWRTGAPARWSYHSPRNLAYTHSIERTQISDYVVREKFKLMRAAGFHPDETTAAQLTLPWFEKHTAPLMKLIGESAGFSLAPLRIALSPTHRREPRRWPLASYAQLADRLVQEMGAYVLWLWGPGEEAVVDEVQAMGRQLTHKAPATSFREMAALMANMDFFVGNSNGPSHVAVAVDIPSLQLHGPTDARSWCPQSERHGEVSALAPMENISVEMVWQRIQQMRPVIEAHAAAMRRVGPRLNWNRMTERGS